MTRTTSKPETLADQAQTFIDWTRLNRTAIAIGGAVVVVSAAAFWFYATQKQIAARNAERQLLLAKQSVSANNTALAQSDLQKVVASYGSTPSGIEAAMLLAQLDYDQGKYQEGITVLRGAVGLGAAKRQRSTILSLIGDGDQQMKKPMDAAKVYLDAAAAAEFDSERGSQMAKAARAYEGAKDTESARKLWAELAEDPRFEAVAAEARVRLGELTAQVAKR
jgi:predicted negative regulator of RcsB-dependent stress response